MSLAELSQESGRNEGVIASCLIKLDMQGPAVEEAWDFGGRPSAAPRAVVPDRRRAANAPSTGNGEAGRVPARPLFGFTPGRRPPLRTRP
ncbi:hypothetical protein ADK60_22610 [Streptomyces sp. XY431]|nr:hypothetical protein ADK60_22610 [Streptomyces sp. XY431]